MLVISLSLAVTKKNGESVVKLLNKRILFFMMITFALSSCEDKGPNAVACSSATIENELTLSLQSLSTDVDFSFYLEKNTGETFLYNRGTSTLNSLYKSASTSKWVTSAAVLRLVESVNGFDLTDKPSDHYPWTMPTGDPLYQATLSELLSFTSGLRKDSGCLSIGLPIKSFDDCMIDLVDANKGLGNAPGSSFHYVSTHIQVAGAMAIGAGGYADWASLFSDFKAKTGLFTNSTFDDPTVNNPRLAGGMKWTGNDYIDFLRAIVNNSITSSATKSLMFTDRLVNMPITKSPAQSGVNQDWHYGYGVWLECNSLVYNCVQTEYYSSPGAYGSYPFINVQKNFFGLIAREGNLGTFPEGYKVYQAVRGLSESWAQCTGE